MPEYASWNELLRALRHNEIDFVANATNTTERAKFAYFSIPYRSDVFAFYVFASNYDKFSSLDFQSLKAMGFRLALTHNYLYGEEIDSWKADPRYNQSLSYTSTPEAGYDLLLEGKVDGIIEDPFVVSYNLRELGISEKIKSLPFQTFGLPVSYMFNKQTVPPALVERFNQALKKVLGMPEYQTIWITPVDRD